MELQECINAERKLLEEHLQKIGYVVSGSLNISDFCGEATITMCIRKAVFEEANNERAIDTGN